MQAEDLMECAALSGACGLLPSDHHEFMRPDLAHLEAFSGKTPVIARWRVLLLDDKDPSEQVLAINVMLDGRPSITTASPRWLFLNRCTPWRGDSNLKETYPEFELKNFIEVR